MFTITKITKYSPLHFMEMILFFISKGQDRIVCHIEYKTAKRGSKRLEMKNYSTIIVSIAFGHRPQKNKKNGSRSILFRGLCNFNFQIVKSGSVCGCSMDTI